MRSAATRTSERCGPAARSWAVVSLASLALVVGCANRDALLDVAPPVDTSAAPDATDVANGADATDATVDPDARAMDADATVADVAPRNVDFVIPGTPAITDGPGRFGGAEDPSRAPSIVYPSPDTLVPPNLRGLEIHFLPGAGNTLFEVSFRGVSGTVRVYTRCARVDRGCVLALDDTTFAAIVAAARPGNDLALRVRGTTDSMGATFGASREQTLGTLDSDLRGGIYYWTAATGSVMRYEFGLPGARAETYVRGDTLLPVNCVGCHVLSRDGRRIAVPRGIPAPAPTRVLDVVTQVPITAEFGSNFGAFSPDASRIIVSDGVRLSLFDGNTGMPATGLASGMVGSHPDWSPDGRWVLFSRPRTAAPIAGTSHGAPADLMLMEYASGAFAAPTSFFASTGDNNYYPAFSPDGNWVLFNRAAGPSSDAPDAQLWTMRFDRSQPPARLVFAEGGVTGNSWPKWAPQLGTYGGEATYWFTFSSRRDYGLRILNSSRMRDSQTTQLWMAAFRPGRSGVGRDGSSPAFWLPFQSPTTGNHIAQWTSAVPRRTCRMDGDCATTEQCVILAAGGVCVGRM